MPEAPGICVCFRGGARQFEGRLEERARKQTEVREGEERMEKVIAVREQTKLLRVCVCVVYLQLCVI